MSTRTTDAGDEKRRGRMAKAEEFARAAHDAQDLDDGPAAYVTLCIHAGIAAADVICSARLGRYSRGENHEDAVALLNTVDHEAARELRSLLSMKTLAAYSHLEIGSDRVRRAGRAMEALLEAARRV